MNLVLRFNVAPRYTPGSPAAVGAGIALQVAAQEREAITAYLEGAHGEKNAKMAETLGLGGIVEERYERADCWIVTDLLTNVKFVRPFSKDGERPERRRERERRLATKYGLPVRS